MLIEELPHTRPPILLGRQLEPTHLAILLLPTIRHHTIRPHSIQRLWLDDGRREACNPRPDGRGYGLESIDELEPSGRLGFVPVDTGRPALV